MCDDPVRVYITRDNNFVQMHCSMLYCITELSEFCVLHYLHCKIYSTFPI